ncbi:structure-specific endonuclease subunit SLX1 [Neocloeon triangulifer]|uniref:structure-specific endonuclease subunit SLX1 n=1 Tax=Neocloeon triangulifer TaxID=2078957 RepID=UPI00286F57C7|nr:structure-specific endonuclease subunit SLX1 [Neocloeon triangulifer]XP_059488108.1 structure-specific endonuclease subunit SLX1 [Neocloeon triangulifer]
MGSEIQEFEGEIEEHFYGVYLLYCTNPQYLGRTYVGFTVNPLRRVKQHNRGSQFGGARRTSNKGPWEMILIVHGFPNDVAALRFEWAWQHPWRSRRLAHLGCSKTAKRTLTFCLGVVNEMLRVGPWRRLPLTLRWLQPKYFATLKTPLPDHMSIVKGALRKADQPHEALVAQEECAECGRRNGLKTLRCLHCEFSAHAACWVQRLGSKGVVLPVEGKCPGCRKKVMWGHIVVANRPPKSNQD